MRKLSPKTKKTIIDVATQEFFDYGFEGANMRTIAKKSNIAVGNIYRYFKNKDALFAEVVSPAFNKIVTLIETKPKDLENYDVDILDTDHILEMFINISQTNPREIVIILDRYLGLKEYVLLDNLEKLIVKRVKSEVKGITDSLASTLSHLILKGTLYILQNNNKNNYKNSLNEFYLFLFKDIEKRIGK